MIKAILVSTLFGALFLVAADLALAIPDVHESYTTRECVRVVNHDSIFFGTSSYSCELLPSKFNHVWVQ
jgi:hypothetical protein